MSFKQLSAADIVTRETNLNQLIDVVEEDISGSLTRKKYQVFVTGTSPAIGTGITSSLFQTVFDQDFSLQTSNEIFDMTFGIFSGSSIVSNSGVSEDTNGKLLFPSQSVMMREKIHVYSQYAQLLLGNNSEQFKIPLKTGTAVDSALFLNFKRLFVRDSIKRETFAMKFYQSASDAGSAGTGHAYNLNVTTETAASIFTDVGAASALEKTDANFNVGQLSLAANTSEKVGLIFYEPGIVLLDTAKILSGTQKMSGTIGAIAPAHEDGSAAISAGRIVLGSAAGTGNPNAKFIPDFIVSASMDDILDHFAASRFQSGSLTSMTFQNNTNINSTIYFCRSTADEFNFSTNPTYTDSTGKILVIDEGQEDTQKAFSFVTSVGLYDDNDDLLAVAKLSRPIEKNDEKDITFRVRLDF